MHLTDKKFLENSTMKFKIEKIVKFDVYFKIKTILYSKKCEVQIKITQKLKNI
jgi:hypothetical protein